MGYIVSFLCSVFLIKDYKKAIIFIAFTVQLLSYWGTGIPGVKIYVLLVLLAFCLYCINWKKIRNSKLRYPIELKSLSVVFLLSFWGTTIIIADFQEWPTVLSNTLTSFVFPFLLWHSIDSSEKVKYAVKVLYCLMFIAVIVAVFEQLFRHNYVTDAIKSLFKIEDFVIDSYAIRYGLKRVNSIFSYFSTSGVAFTFSFVVFYVDTFFLKTKRRNHALMAFLCLLCAFASGSRAIFLGLFLCLFVLTFSKRFYNYPKGRVVLFVAFLLLPLLVYTGQSVLDSMINSNGSEVGGSTVHLRELQWEACEPSFLQSKWLGNGRLYIWREVKPHHLILQGAESIWFSILVDYGLMGAFAFLFLIASCCVLLYKYNKKLVCVPLGYLLILSLSPDSGIQYNILITFVVLLVKMYIYQPKTNEIVLKNTSIHLHELKNMKRSYRKQY